MEKPSNRRGSNHLTAYGILIFVDSSIRTVPRQLVPRQLVLRQLEQKSFFCIYET